MKFKDFLRSVLEPKTRFLRSIFCAFPSEKANPFLNISTVENPLPQEFSRDKVFLMSFS